jgi:hypothetical protein
MLNLRLLVTSVMLLLIGAGFASEAGAQPSTTLRLFDQAVEHGGTPIEGEVLSQGTQVAILSSTRENTAHAFSNIDFGRADLAEYIQEGDAELFRLVEGGRTPRPFEETETSDNFYYVLALTGQGELLESYVEDDTRGGRFYPGFARVVTGDMTMGPVPAEHQKSMRTALESAMNSGGTDTTTPGPGNDENSKAGSTSAAPTLDGQEGTGNGSSEASGGIFSALLSTLGSWFGSWYGGVITGLLIGGGGVWGGLYKRYSNKLSRRQKRISKLKRDLYNERKDNSKGLRSAGGWSKSEERKNKRVEDIREEVKSKNKKIRDLRERVKKLRQKKRERRDSKDVSGVSDHSRHSGKRDSASQQSQQNAGDRIADLIGQAFVNWCNDAGAAMVDRHSMFAKRLEEGLPEAELQRIFREKNAAGIVFADDVQDAVEYWLVRADGKDFLLPQPQRSGFREVEKCFRASCTSPKQLREFEPAELQSSGGKYELESAGRLA